MFCTSLRRRPSTKDLVPRLVEANGLNLKEAQLTTHDISLPLPSSKTPQSSRLLFLVVTPSCVAETQLSKTLDRIHHFAAQTGGVNSAIMFLLADVPSMSESEPKPQALQAYSVLTHAMLFDTVSTGNASNPTSSLPILPLESPLDVQPIIKGYLAGLERPHTLENTRQKPQSSEDLLQYCSVSAPLKPEQSLGMGDEYVDLKDLVRAVRRENGEQASSDSFDSRDGSARLRLQAILGREATKDVIDFWTEEYVAE